MYESVKNLFTGYKKVAAALFKLAKYMKSQDKLIPKEMDNYVLDFILASTTVNRWVMRVVGPPGFDYSWTASNAIVWAKLSIPSSVLAVCMALFIPRLQSLTGLLNSIAGATLQITAVPAAL